MDYKLAIWFHNGFEISFYDQLKRVSELSSVLSGDFLTSFKLLIDVEKNEAILFKTGDEDIPLAYVDGDVPLSSLEDISSKKEKLNETLTTMTKFISGLYKNLYDVKSKAMFSFSKDEWDVIYDSSTKNVVTIVENGFTDDIKKKCVKIDESFNSTYIYVCKKLGIDDKFINMSLGIEDTVDMTNDEEDDYLLSFIKENATISNQPTEKGWGSSDDRVMVKQFDSKIKVVQFDKHHDFTVGSLIKALSNFDLDMPVTVISSAPAIGNYDEHIHKIDLATMHGFDKKEAVGLYLDNSH